MSINAATEEFTIIHKTQETRESNSNHNGIKKIDYDDLLSSAGEFGLYQVLLFISTFPFYIFGVFVYFSQLFMTEVSPNHWCWIPELENFTDIERRNLAIPIDENARFGYSQCQEYVANWSEVLQTGQTVNHSWRTVPCQNGWEFNKTEIPYPTISREMRWVCDKDSYQATAQSIFFVGCIFGGFLIGWIADRYGRLPAAVASNMIGCVAGVGSSFSRNFVEFVVYRFFMGMSYDNCMMMIYLLTLEYVAPRYRTVTANLPFALFYTLGVTALPWIALACGHWKTIGLVTSLPLALSLLALFIMPESPRWLLSKGRIDDAVKKVLTIGRINKKEIPTKLIEKFKFSTTNISSDESENIFELFKRPLVRRTLICMCCQYMCCMIVFDALVRSLGQLGFNFFISFTIMSSTELPSLLLISFILDLTGRKSMSIVTLVLSCLLSFTTAFVPSGLPSMICAVITRFLVNMSCNTGMQWAAEMLPTSARGTGASMVHICGYVATVISPFIVYLDIWFYWLPLVVVGCVAGLGAMITLALPETAKKVMPQTFDDAENLIRNQKLWEVPFLQKKENNKQGQDNETFEM